MSILSVFMYLTFAVTPLNTATAPNPVSPDVVFLDENNKEVSLNALRGKVVFINFWATWCPPCRAELPSIHKLKQAFKDNDKIVFLFVDIDGNMAKSKAFMKKHKYDLPVYIPKSPIPSNFLGRSIPTTVIIDKKGKMVGHIEGSMNYSTKEVIKGIKDLTAA